MKIALKLEKMLYLGQYQTQAYMTLVALFGLYFLLYSNLSIIIKLQLKSKETIIWGVFWHLKEKGGEGFYDLKIE